MARTLAARAIAAGRFDLPDGPVYLSNLSHSVHLWRLAKSLGVTKTEITPPCDEQTLARIEGLSPSPERDFLLAAFAGECEAGMHEEYRLGGCHGPVYEALMGRALRARWPQPLGPICWAKPYRRPAN